MHLKLLTPEKNVYDGDAVSVQMPGSDGLFQVLENHAPLISSLDEGIVKVETDKGTEHFKITGGFAEVLNNEVTVLVEGIQAKKEETS